MSEIKIKIDPADINDKSILRNLLELYQYDFTEFDRADIGDSGKYGYRYLDHYWTEPDRHPFLIKVSGKLAGFVLVSKYNYLSTDEDTRVIAEFFIMRKYRRRGIGTQTAFNILDSFPGHWQVAQTTENIPAQEFWKPVIDQYTDGHFTEHYLDNETWHGPVLAFDNTELKIT
jgi:predicted acetyltransferase